MVVTFYVDYFAALVKVIVAHWLHLYLFDDLMIIRNECLTNACSSLALVQLAIEVVKSYHDGCDVIARPTHRICLENRIHGQSC